MYFRVKNTLKNNIYYTLKHSFQQLFFLFFISISLSRILVRVLLFNLQNKVVKMQQVLQNLIKPTLAYESIESLFFLEFYKFLYTFSIYLFSKLNDILVCL
jgi:hypothetical protein